jgi:vacuolar-type H+-ATPase subunit I/STV1
MWEKMLQIEEQGVSLMKMIETSQMADGSSVSQNEEGDANLKSPHSKFESFLEKVDAVEIEMKMMKDEMQEVKEKIDSEIQEVKDEMQEVKEKIDSEMQKVKKEMQEMKEMVSSEMQEMKEMMSKMMGMMAK